MAMSTLFVTRFYEEDVDEPILLEGLRNSCLALSEGDAAGRRWSRVNGYRGYTSYASLNDLPKRDPDMAMLVRLVDRHVARFTAACGMDLKGRRLRLDSLWVNVLKP